MPGIVGAFSVLRTAVGAVLIKFPFLSRGIGLDRDRRNYDILWNQIELLPSVQLKYGIRRRLFPLKPIATETRGHLHFQNEHIDLEGRWDNSPDFGSLLIFKLKNRSSSSIRITRLVFPTENGLDDFIRDFDPQSISFLRNGYQSWSTARSYRVKDKPLRPRLKMVSLASSNMANLPSNTPGMLSSEMFSIITDLRKTDSFLVGQSAPFNQFFYILLNLFKQSNIPSHFELVYDFGRKMLAPGESLTLDGIIMAKGRASELQYRYFDYLRTRMKLKFPPENLNGWCSWYYYFNKISPKDILSNLQAAQQRDLPFDYFQIDDGYQTYVGDWLDQSEGFEGKMGELASRIRDAGYTPGIWLAPFIADRKSELVQNHPEYVLRNEYGSAITAGYNRLWPGRVYYGLDITHPRFNEHIRNVIRHIAKEWGYVLLKCDFLFGGCLRGGNHHELALSRAEVLKLGMQLIREEAGKQAIIVGCGMPLSTGIGTVDIMRVGPDTGPYWLHKGARILNTGAMVGVRNSLRNFMVRSAMHRQLWLSDPDCIMIRRSKTHLDRDERLMQINAIILSGGILSYSDDLSRLSEEEFQQMQVINRLSDACAVGHPLALDLMEREVPELYYNSAGYLGVFNASLGPKTKRIHLKTYMPELGDLHGLTDVWSEHEFTLTDDDVFELKHMPAHSSRLFRCHRNSDEKTSSPQQER